MLESDDMTNDAAERPEVVVITGASAGVGRAAVRRFASAGAHIALIARDGERLDTAVEEIANLGGRGIAITADVASRDEIEAAASRAEEELGPIDVWINNASATVFGPATSLTPEEIRRITDVTYLGTVWGTLAALARMSARKTGKIVQVCSAQSFRGLPLESAFAGASHAIRGFTDSLRAELLHEKSGVHLSQVILPAMNTPRYQWARNHAGQEIEPSPIYQPEIAAEAVHWIAHHDRRDLTLGWGTLGLIWSDRLLPEAVDAWLGGPAFDARLSGDQVDAERKDNLFEPVPGNFAAHGELDPEATRSQVQLVANEHRGIVLGAIGLLGFLAWLRRR